MAIRADSDLQGGRVIADAATAFPPSGVQALSNPIASADSPTTLRFSVNTDTINGQLYATAYETSANPNPSSAEIQSGSGTGAASTFTSLTPNSIGTQDMGQATFVSPGTQYTVFAVHVINGVSSAIVSDTVTTPSISDVDDPVIVAEPLIVSATQDTMTFRITVTDASPVTVFYAAVDRGDPNPSNALILASESQLLVSGVPTDFTVTGLPNPDAPYDVHYIVRDDSDNQLARAVTYGVTAPVAQVSGITILERRFVALAGRPPS